MSDYLNGSEAAHFEAMTKMLDTVYDVKRSMRGTMRMVPSNVRRALKRSIEALAEGRLALWKLACKRAARDGIDWLPLDDGGKMPGVKRCPGCKRDLPYSEFYRNQNRGNGIAGTCKECARAYQKTRNAERSQANAA